MWSHWGEYLQRAIERSGGNATIDYVRSRVEDGSNTTHLWPGRKSAAVTEVCWCGDRPELNIWLAAGDKDELLNGMLPAAEKFARELGCVAITATGRKGWTRELRRHGYEPVAYTVKKELHDG